MIDRGHHRLLIGTIIVAPANDRYPGDPVGSARPANGSLRRFSGTQPLRLERPFLPLSRHSGAPRTGRVGWQAALLADCRVAPGEANLYPVNPISTRGASELILERYWRKEGRAGNDGRMLLFGISTAYICAVMRAYWPPSLMKISCSCGLMADRGPIAQKRLRSPDALGYSKTDYVR